MCAALGIRKYTLVRNFVKQADVDAEKGMDDEGVKEGEPESGRPMTGTTLTPESE